jgi:hypothetical protein
MDGHLKVAVFFSWQQNLSGEFSAPSNRIRMAAHADSIFRISVAVKGDENLFSSDVFHLALFHLALHAYLPSHGEFIPSGI